MFSRQVGLGRVAAPAGERSTRNIALTVAANIKFFVNRLIGVQSLVVICGAPVYICRREYLLLVAGRVACNAASGGRVGAGCIPCAGL